MGFGENETKKPKENSDLGPGELGQGMIGMTSTVSIQGHLHLPSSLSLQTSFKLVHLDFSSSFPRKVFSVFLYIQTHLSLTKPYEEEKSMPYIITEETEGAWVAQSVICHWLRS